ETLAQISAEAERLWWRLVVVADDFGCYDGRTRTILGKCMTAFLGQVTEDDIAAWLDELEAAGLIQRYEVDGRPYLHLCTWDKHQQRRAKTPKYPLPPSLAGGRADTQRDDSNCNHVQSDAGI